MSIVADKVINKINKLNKIEDVIATIFLVVFIFGMLMIVVGFLACVYQLIFAPLVSIWTIILIFIGACASMGSSLIGLIILWPLERIIEKIKSNNGMIDDE